MAKKKEPVEVQENEGYAVANSNGYLHMEMTRTRKRDAIADFSKEVGTPWKELRKKGYFIQPVRVTPIDAIDGRRG